MRVTGGTFSGRILEIPKGPRIRPTQDQVRAALFNMLGEQVNEAKVLDLFAGSGAMGIEALSRGAAHVTFVDRSPFCVRAIRENLEKIGLSPWGMAGKARRSARHREPPTTGIGSVKGVSAERMWWAFPASTHVIQSDAVGTIRKLAAQKAVFDLVILDPPYGGNWARKVLNALGHHAIVAPAGWVIAEHDKRDSLPGVVDGATRRLVTQRIERHGDTAITFFA